MTYFVHGIKTEREMTETLKKIPKIDKDDKNAFFCDNLKKNILNFCTLITFIHKKKKLNEMICDIKDLSLTWKKYKIAKINIDNEI